MAANNGLLWLVCFLVNSVSALPWIGPQQTLSAISTANWSPAPTKEAHELLKRDLYPVSLCGWQGPQFQGVYCSSESSCAWFTDYSVVGCCSIGGSCDAVYTGCIDGNHPPQTVSYPGIFTCTSNSVCYQNSYPNGYYQYGCGSTSIGQNVVTSWTGINPQFSILVTYTGGVLDHEAPVTLISSTPPKISNPIPSPSSTPPTTTPSPTPSPSPSPSPKPSPSPTPSSPVVNSPPPTTTKESVTPTTVSLVPPTIISPTTDSTLTPSSVKSSSVTNSHTTLSGTTTSSKDSTGSSSSTASTTLPPGITPVPIVQGNSKGLSTGAKIAIGVVVGFLTLVIIAFLIFWCCVRNRNQKDSPMLINDNGGGHHPTPPILINNVEKADEPDQGYYAPMHNTPDASTAAAWRPQSVESRGNTESPAPAYEHSPAMTAVPRMASVPNMRDNYAQRTVRPVTEAVPELD